MNRYIAVALLLFAAGPTAAAQRTLERSFDVAPGGTLTVDADSASVTITGADTQKVTVRMLVRGAEDKVSEAQLDAVESGDDVNITLKLHGRGWFNWGSWRGDATIEVTVPRRYSAIVRTSGGSVKIEHVTGSAKLNTSGGSISAKDLDGRLDARTSGGGIHVETIRGDVDANTSGGDVRLVNVDGKIRTHTSGGSIHCTLVGTNRGITARTSGGSIRLTLPRETTANVKATTSGGGISSDLPIASTQHQSGRVEGVINGGGAPIEASTSGGSISLHAAN